MKLSASPWTRPHPLTRKVRTLPRWRQAAYNLLIHSSFSLFLKMLQEGRNFRSTLLQVIRFILSYVYSDVTWWVTRWSQFSDLTRLTVHFQTTFVLITYFLGSDSNIFPGKSASIEWNNWAAFHITYFLPTPSESTRDRLKDISES
jgi:hypothetical protein